MSRLSIALIATLSVVALTRIAAAADMPTKAPVSMPAAPAVYNWTGFYVGGHVGYGWSKSTGSFADPNDAAFTNCGPCFQPGFASPNIDLSKSGFLGGLHAGYNWQFAPTWLVGIEGDFTWTSLSASSNTGLTAFTAGGVPFAASTSSLNFQADPTWLASVRGRLGFIQNNWLFYGTAGVAWTHLDFTANAACGAPNCGAISAPVSVGDTRTGWVAGGGVAWQVPASSWRVSAEYLYYAFHSTDFVSTAWQNTGGPATCLLAGPCVATYGLGNVTVQEVRVGLSYAFR